MSKREREMLFDLGCALAFSAFLVAVFLNYFGSLYSSITETREAREDAARQRHEEEVIRVQCDRVCHPHRGDGRLGECWCMPLGKEAFPRELP